MIQHIATHNNKIILKQYRYFVKICTKGLRRRQPSSACSVITEGPKLPKILYKIVQSLKFSKDENILDIFFTNRPSLVRYCIGASGISDHDIVLASFYSKVMCQNEIEHKCYLWAKANFDEMREKLFDYGNDFINTNNVETPVEQLWFSFCDHLLITIDKFVPSKIV